MLVLTRKLNETIVIDGNISITLVAIRGNQVRLGITAPSSIGIYRSELCGRTTDRKDAAAIAPPVSEHAVL